MATLEQLSTALRNADAAGDTDAARALAGEIVKLREPKESKGALGYLGDVGQSLAGGATFGYFDEIAAKGGELLGIGNYESNVKALRDREANISPWINIPGQVAGAVGTTLATLPVAAPAAAALGATRAGALLARLPQALKFGALGAAEGALAGSGSAKEGERLQGAAMGAPLGGLVGAAAPSIVRGASNVANRVRGAFSPEANVSADLARAMARDGDNAATIMARANNMSIDRPGVATLADAGGENVKGLVERVAQTPGGGRTQVVPALTGRQQMQAARIGSDLRSLTGTSRTAMQAVDETIAERATAAKPLYDKAMSVDLSQSPEGMAAMQAMLNEVKTGWGKAIVNSPNFRRTLQTEYGISNPNDITRMMPVIDAWKKQADDMIGEAVRSGNANKARVLTQMKERVVSAVDNANPDYKAARSAWEGPSKYLDAIERGRDVLSSKVSAEEFTARFRALSPVEQEAERIGAVSAIVAKMGNKSAKMPDYTYGLGSPEVRSKIAAIMPTQDAAEAWARRLDFEQNASGLTNRALGNSATYRRLAERQDADSLVMDLAADALTGTPQSIIKKVIGAGPKWLRDTLRSRADKELAGVLTDPQRMNDLPQILNRVGRAGRAPSTTTNIGATAGMVELLNQ